MLPNAKFISTLLILACGASASPTIVGNGPFGLLAEATIDIPPDPDNTPIGPLMDYSSYSQTFMIDITGGTGAGYMFFDIYELADNFAGSLSESMQSYSGISSPFDFTTPP